MKIPANTISAPIQKVELMSFIGEKNKDDTWELTPHTFLKITDINGNESFVGFAPNVTGLTGSGQIQNDALHPVTNSSGPISLTPEQGARLQEYINNSIDNPPYYNLPEGQHCAVWAANGILEAITGHGLNEIGMLGTAQTDFGPLGAIICELVNPYTLALCNEMFPVGPFLNALLNGISDFIPFFPGDDPMGHVNDLFGDGKAATPPPRRDPLILDLDGDGIETAASTDGAYFDHDDNGFAERTGWVSSDDGLLVLDRNGNGIIDNGKELFGDQTILANGQTAANGFKALAELDSNHDGKIDINDTAYSQLRVWRDMDGNGYSSSNELFKLSDLGITSINTGYTSTNVNDGNGNTQVQAGTFEKADGTTNRVGSFLLKRIRLLKNAHMLRCASASDVAAYAKSTPHFPGFARLASEHF